MKNFRKIWKYLWLTLRNYRLAFFGAFFFFGSAVAVADSIIPLFVKNLTNAIEKGQLDEAISVLWVLLGLAIGMRLFVFIAMHILSWFQSNASRDLHTFSYDQFTKHSYHFYKNQFTGSLVSKSSRLGENMIRIVDNVLFNFFALGITTASILVVLFIEHANLGFLFLGFLVVYLTLTFWMAGKLTPLYETRSRSKSKFTGVISDIITNIQTILFFGNGYLDKELYREANQDFYTKRYRAWRTATNYQDLIGMLPNLFTVGVTFYAVHLVSIDVLSLGSVVFVFLVGNNFNSQVWRLGGSMKRLASDVSDTIEAIEVIEEEVSVIDRPETSSINMPNGSISFNNVSFTYPEGEHVFEAFDLVIPQGQSVGIVGKSGSGKTTITKLLLRLYDLDVGTISIDDQDIASVAQNDLRSHIAYIPQDTILFHRPIYNNIAYGNPEADKAQIITAAQAAYVDEFVQDLNEGYDTKVGERGVKLSGGQRQRIGIARAMLKKDAPILIMDEATSSLDTLSEQYIQKSFESLLENRTTIVIAHRLSTIQKMDRIIVLNKGKIVEDGSHTELLAKDGYYAELWNSQTNGFIE